MISAQSLISAHPSERKELILSQITGFDSLGELEQSRAISSILNEFLEDYFQIKIQEGCGKQGGSVLSENLLKDAFEAEIEKFLPVAIAELQNSLPTKEILKKSAKNVYEMSGAVKLAFANKVTRNLSTTMGLLWERLANVSPYAINPETEFHLKVKGIDLISKNINTGVIEYQQLKTQHNTLTGSQKTRSVQELQIHENPVFCVCFANNSSWTFSHPDIPRVSGKDFWSRIGISYEIFLEVIENLVLQLEEEYVKLL